MGNILLITGASGFVGSHAVKFALESPNYDVVVATDIREPDFLSEAAGNPKFKFIKASLTEPQDFKKIEEFLKAYPEWPITIWHIGGCFNYSVSRELLYRVNVLGTKMLLETFLPRWLFTRSLQRFVFWSGGVVYGGFNHPKGTLPADENYPVDPQNDYGWSKKEAEDWVLYFHKQFNVPVTIMRLGAVYGPKSIYGMANALFLNASGQLAPLLAGNPENKAALIHSEDVVRAADFLSWAPEADGEIYNVVDDALYTLKEVSKLMGEKLNNKPYTSVALPAWVLKTLIGLVNRRAKQLKGMPVIDPELGNMVLLNSWVTNQKLKALAHKRGRDDLLKYADSLAGLEQAINWYKKEGKL